jgi:cytochrome c oxidase subunit 4
MPRVRTYIVCWAALLGLLGLTCASAFVPLGAFNAVVNFGVAAAKAVLIASFFMHLRQATALVRIFSVVGLCVLLLLFGLSGADYATRGTSPAPWAAPQPRQIAPY